MPYLGLQHRRPGRAQPDKSQVELAPKHFTGQLTRANVWGEFTAGARDGFFAVRWSNFFAYLHQFDAASQAALIAECKAAQYRRDYPHVRPNEES